MFKQMALANRRAIRCRRAHTFRSVREWKRERGGALLYIAFVLTWSTDNESDIEQKARAVSDQSHSSAQLYDCSILLFPFVCCRLLFPTETGETIQLALAKCQLCSRISYRFHTAHRALACFVNLRFPLHSRTRPTDCKSVERKNNVGSM